MTQWLKQSTAAVIPFGPFVDPTDGVTLVTGLVSAIDHGTTGIKLSKNGGAKAVRHATVTASSYDAHGDYLVTLDTTDTNTLGRLRVSFADASTNLVVWQDFMIVPANIWDSYFGASLQKVDVDTIKTNPVVNGGTITFPTNATVASTTGAVGSVTGSVASVSGNVGGNVVGSVASVSGNVGGNVVGSVGSVTGLTASNLDTTVSSRLASGSYTAPPSAGTIASTVWASVMEGSVTAVQMMRGFAAALLGKASGLATTTAVYRDVNDTKDRITATVDADGNRSAVTTDLT